jgi:ABC-type multidrug transport system ATPase subunit
LLRVASDEIGALWRTGTAEQVAHALGHFVQIHADGLRKAIPAKERGGGEVGWSQKVGHWLFNVDHIHIEYALEYDGVPIEQLSPGTRGIVLLLLYLAIDVTDRRPLIIDQPEDNLDPQSVQHDLVPHFREARNRRQIIIVTHNANLVVNTDVDQVIVASAARAVSSGLPDLTYRSGALENPEIRSAVCAILEGGERAFLERERRYRLQWSEVVARTDQEGA